MHSYYYYVFPLSFMKCFFICMIILLLLSSILSDINITTSAFLCLWCAQCIFPHNFTYNFLCFCLKCISYKQPIVKSWFFIQSCNFFLLIGILTSSTFNINIDTFRFISTMFLFVFSFISPVFCSSIPLSCLHLVNEIILVFHFNFLYWLVAYASWYFLRLP